MDVLHRYFTEIQARQIRVAGDLAVVGDACFRIQKDGTLKLERYPDDAWLHHILPTLSETDKVWEVVAFLKVRHFSDGTKVLARARTGDLYDEDYYTRRGGGGPYTGYSCMERLQDYFDRLAAELVERFGPCSILDSGCATGLLVRRLQMLGATAHGFDVSDWAVSNAVAENVTRQDARSLDYPDGSFDVVVSQDFMEHIHPDEHDLVLSEQLRVLRAGGSLVHYVPFYDTAEPYQLDAHLCNASRDWWIKRFSSVPGTELMQSGAADQDFSTGSMLSRYFVMRKRQE